MKKLIKYILLIIIVVFAVPPKNSTLSSLVRELNYTNAVSTYYTNSEVNVKNATVIKNGNSYLVQSDIKNCESLKKEIENIQGQSISLNGTYSDYLFIKEKLLDSTIIEEELYNIKTCYGYNNKLTKSVKIDNKNINIQVAFNNNKIVIGSPVILGSY